MKKITKQLALIAFILIMIAGCSRPQSAETPSETDQTEPIIEPADTVEDADLVEADSSEAEEELALSEGALQPVSFSIIPGESNAHFQIDETLKSSQTGWHTGARKTVIGTTDQVFGAIAFSLSDPAAARFDDIRVNADTFRTDDPYRNIALKKLILESKTYEYITFSPIEVIGLPEAVAVGEEIRFELAGELTIREITLPQRFAVTGRLAAPDRIEGTATAVVTREAYDLEIVVAPHVTDIDDEVKLTIDFVASAE